MLEWIARSASAKQFFTDWDVPGHDPSHDIPPIWNTPSETTVGDLLLVGMVVYSANPLSTTPTQTGWDLVFHEVVQGRVNSTHFHVILWSRIATVGGIEAWDFTEAYHSFNGITWTPVIINRVGCLALVRDQAVSWQNGVETLIVDYPPGTPVPPTSTLVTGVGGFPDRDVLFFTYVNDGALFWNIDIAPANPADEHLNLLLVTEEVVNADGIISVADMVDGADGGDFSSFGVFFTQFTPPVSYNCTPDGCIDPGDGSGTYATLEECEAACEVAPSWNCVDGVCIDPGDGSGIFPTLDACHLSGCGSTAGSARTVRFDAGEGSAYYLVAPIVDSGDELRSKVLKAVHQTGRRTNVSVTLYGYDIADGISISDLENGTNSSTGPIPLDDSVNVSQSEREQVNVPNATLWTVRIEGDDTGQSVRNQIHEIVVELAQQGVRR